MYTIKINVVTRDTNGYVRQTSHISPMNDDFEICFEKSRADIEDLKALNTLDGTEILSISSCVELTKPQ